jgi:hypothetical protein
MAPIRFINYPPGGESGTLTALAKEGMGARHSSSAVKPPAPDPSFPASTTMIVHLLGIAWLKLPVVTNAQPARSNVRN